MILTIHIKEKTVGAHRAVEVKWEMPKTVVTKLEAEYCLAIRDGILKALDEHQQKTGAVGVPGESVTRQTSIPNG